MNNIEKSKKDKKRIVGAITSVFLIVSVILCLIVAIQVLGKGYASFGKFSFFRVVTGSMEPDIHVGSLIMSEKTDIDEINIGDVITFKSKTADIYGSIVTHRVIEKTYSESGTVLLRTKGDANSATDVLPVDANNFVGKVTGILGNTNFISKILSFFTSQSGFIVCIVLPILVISSILMQNSIKSIKRNITELSSEFDELKKNNEGHLIEETESDKGSVNSEKGSPTALTEEEYKAIYEKIRAELIVELKEELIESDEREQTE